MGAGSVFRVGEDVDLGQMLVNFTVLAVGLMAFEKALHVLEHKTDKYPKYKDMINKVYRELMILGLIGLAIKMAKEAGVLNDSSAEMTAFLSADLAIFFMAIALIIQAICIFLQLRRKNKQIDVLELFTSHDLYLLASSHERHQKIKHPIVRAWKATKYDDLMAMRLMRHLFLETHGLPELFPFAKYLRQAQDSQIRHMIDVEPTTWLVVFLVAWLWYASVSFLAHTGWFGEFHATSTDDSRRLASSNSTATSAQSKTMRGALATVFMLFVWTLTIAHIFTALYLQWCRLRILQYAGVKSRKQMISRLKVIADEEATVLSKEVTAEAMQKMLQVEEDQQLEQHHHLHHHHQNYDFATEAIEACFRRIFGHRQLVDPAQHQPERPPRHSNDHRDTSTDGEHKTHELELPYFSHHGWHFWIMLLLILNGLYVAFFVQIVFHYEGTFMTEYGAFFAILLPLPIVLNIWIQTFIIRDFVLVGSIWRVNVTTLSEVIEHFTEVVELQTTFISEVHDCLVSNNKTLHELAVLLDRNDWDRTGWIDIEDLRQALATIGFHMSFFRFNSVMKLLFELRQLKVDYRQVITLIRMAEEHHNAPTPNPHDEIPYAASVIDGSHKPSLSASSTAFRLRRSIERMEAVPHSLSFMEGQPPVIPTAHPHEPCVVIQEGRPTLQEALLRRSAKFTQQLSSFSNLNWRSSMAHSHFQRPRAPHGSAAYYYTHGSHPDVQASTTAAPDGDAQTTPSAPTTTTAAEDVKYFRM